MTEPLLHPTSERFEAYVDGTLPDAERAVLESHLHGCPRCAAALEEWQALFDGLAALPRPEPSADFADRVIAGIDIRPAWHARLAAALSRLLPTTTAGWSLAVAILALPALATAGATVWLFSRPWMSVQGLWLFATERATQGAAVFYGWIAQRLLQTGVGEWLTDLARTFGDGLDPSHLGAALGGFAVLTTLSAWILYRNLFRTSTREDHHVSYCL